MANGGSYGPARPIAIPLPSAGACPPSGRKPKRQPYSQIADDPYEMNNLYGDPAYSEIVPDLQRRLLDWTLRTDPDRPFISEVAS